MSKTAFTATISGVVQGVGFRFFTLRKARQLGVVGYVKNLPDGGVEAYAEGEREVLELFLSELRKGPYGSVVDKVEVEWKPPVGNYRDFEITY